jgi:hypothetical protein
MPLMLGLEGEGRREFRGVGEEQDKVLGDII